MSLTSANGSAAKWCPDCGGKTLLPFSKTSEPGIDARCSACGYVHYKQVKVNIFTLQDTIIKLIDEFGLSFEDVATKSGHTVEFIKTHYNDGILRRSSSHD